MTSVYTPSPYVCASLPLLFPPLLFLPELTYVRLPSNSGSFDLRQPNGQVSSAPGLLLRPHFGSYLEILGTELCNILCMKVFICDLLLFHFHIIVILCYCLIWLFLFGVLSPCCNLYPIRFPQLFCVSPTHDVLICTQVHLLRSNQKRSSAYTGPPSLLMLGFFTLCGSEWRWDLRWVDLSVSDGLLDPKLTFFTDEANFNLGIC
jgi:hypothetical protein